MKVQISFEVSPEEVAEVIGRIALSRREPEGLEELLSVLSQRRQPGGESDFSSQIRQAFERARERENAMQEEDTNPYPLEEDMDELIEAEQQGALSGCNGGMDCSNHRWVNLIRHYQDREKSEDPDRDLRRLGIHNLDEFKARLATGQLEYISLLADGARGPNWAEEVFAEAQELLHRLSEKLEEDEDGLEEDFGDDEEEEEGEEDPPFFHKAGPATEPLFVATPVDEDPDGEELKEDDGS